VEEIGGLANLGPSPSAALRAPAFGCGKNDDELRRGVFCAAQLVGFGIGFA
jgi:hypothetical protein